MTPGATHRIIDRIDTIGLNVATENAAARTVYESIGFTPVLTYDEAELA